MAVLGPGREGQLTAMFYVATTIKPEMKGGECGFSSKSITAILPASLGISISMRSLETWESTAPPTVPRKAFINAENTCFQGSAHNQERNTSTQVSHISEMILTCFFSV